MTPIKALWPISQAQYDVLWPHSCTGAHQALFLYVRSRINIHGGYFDGTVTQKLIYRLACLGFAGTAAVYGSEDPCWTRARRIRFGS
jgi:hypothetical protein